jgi:diguanylate cyclase (GGDEF)-like protein
VDLDSFKTFNDTRGHAEGDALLVDAAEAWRHVLRPSDFLARLGGDEFVVLLPDIELEDAELVVDRLRAATPRGQTASVGIVSWNRGEDPDAVLARADQLLYAAKAAGRNCVVADSAPQQAAALEASLSGAPRPIV